MNKISFFKESINNLKTVGTLTRSSKFLCKKMAEQVNYKKAKFIVELGAGDGVITKHILDRMADDAYLMSFEVNPKFCETIREIQDDRLILVEDTVEKLPQYLKKHSFEGIDAVVSAIPFVAFPHDLSYEIVELCRDNMKNDAPFIQVHYSLLTKKMYKKVFGYVDVQFVPLNIPPAFVLVSKRDPQHLTTS